MKGKELLQDIQKHLIDDEQPGIYLDRLMKDGRLEDYPFSYLSKLTNTEQSVKYHPEGNAWIHTLMVVDEAAKVRDKSTDPMEFMLAALLHDIGKPQTTRKRKGRITSYGHDAEGEKIAREILTYFKLDDMLINRVAALVGYHMHLLYVTKDLPYGRVEEMCQNGDILEIALLGWCDRMGRTNTDPDEARETVEAFYQKVTGKQFGRV